MALRKIFTEKASCLYRTARPVEHFNKRLHDLIDDLADTMYDAEGVGLAANQVGILRRVCVIDVGEGLIELVNPKILSCEGIQQGFEACLSFPERKGYVERPQTVHFTAYDRFGKLHEYTATDFLARAVMHETDHLDGRVYLSLVTEPPEGFVEDNDEEEADD